MKYIFLFFFSLFAFGQDSDTINLKEVSLIDYSKFKQFKPKYKSKHPFFDESKNELIIFSNFQVPKQDEVEILAIEILFNSKRGKRMVCNKEYFFSLKIIKDVEPSVNLIDDKWFLVESSYTGKFIFPVNIIIKQKEINDYLLGVQTEYSTSNCNEYYSYFDLLTTKEPSNLYFYPTKHNVGLLNTGLKDNSSLNYIIYYK